MHSWMESKWRMWRDCRVCARCAVCLLLILFAFFLLSFPLILEFSSPPSSCQRNVVCFFSFMNETQLSTLNLRRVSSLLRCRNKHSTEWKKRKELRGGWYGELNGASECNEHVEVESGIMMVMVFCVWMIIERLLHSDSLVGPPRTVIVSQPIHVKSKQSWPTTTRTQRSQIARSNNIL